MIRHIFLDMGGVVLCQDSEEAFRRFRAAGIDTDIYMGAFGQKDFFLDLETGRIDTEVFCQKMAQAAGRAHISYAEAQQCWLGFVANVPQWSIDALVDFRQHYGLYLLSNTNPFVMSYVRSTAFDGGKHGIAHYFDDLFCSCEMGVCKPEAEIYRLATVARGMRPEECLFVDDSPKNIAAAAQFGMHTLCVATNEPWPNKLRARIAELHSPKQ